MPEKSEIQRRKQLRRAEEATQRAIEEAALPMPKETLWALFDHLHAARAEGCDFSLRRTEQFLLAHHLQSAPVVPWLESYGGFCDCEVLLNVEARWRRQ
jgi:hypothetical protein